MEKDKIKLFFVSNTARIAGAEICLLNLIKGLDKRIFEPVVLFPETGPLHEEIKRLNIKTYVSPLEWWIRGSRSYGLIGSDIRSRVTTIQKILRQEKPTIVHTNTSAVWEGALAAAFEGIPHIWHLHEIIEGHPSLTPFFPIPFFYSLIDLLSDQVIVVSDSVRQRIKGFAHPEKINLIFNGVETSPFDSKEDKTLREELGLPSEHMIVVTIGSLIPEKDYDALIDAAALVKKSGEDTVTFVIVGWGSPKAVQSLSKMIESRGVRDSVCYLGYRRDIDHILNGSDIVVIPSLSEAFSLVVLEAMRAGKAVITTNCGGPSEIVQDGHTGFIVPVHDPQGLANKILTLNKDKTRRLQMGLNGRDRFDKDFKVEKFTEKISNLYLDLSSKGKINKLTDIERTLIQDFMEIYQKRAEKKLVKGIRHELKQQLKRVIVAPLHPLQRLITWYKKLNFTQ